MYLFAFLFSALLGYVYGHSCGLNPDICDPLNSIICPNGRCVDLSRACDGKNDCPDGLDEHPSQCFPTTLGCKYYKNSIYTNFTRNIYYADHWIGKCQNDSINDQSGLESMSCTDGKWPRSFSYCAPCGVIKYQPDGFLSSLTKEQIALTQAPWHVGLYEIINGKYVYACSATLISPSFVLTSDKCIENNEGKHKTLKVLAGKFFKDWYRYECTVQESDVHKIFVKGTKPSSYLSNNVALLYLAKKFDLNAFIQPACVTKESLARKIRVAEVVEWLEGVSGTYSKSLHRTTVDLYSRNRCLDNLITNIDPIKYVTSDKLCVTGLRGKDSHGSGVVVKHNSKFYVIGIIFDYISENVGNFTVVTNLKSHIEFIKDDYSTELFDHVCREGYFHCKNGACLAKKLVCNGEQDCADGSDETNEACQLNREPEIIGGCLLPEIPGGWYLRIKCKNDDNCPQIPNKQVQNGTSVKIKCYFGYESSAKEFDTSDEFTCQSGDWSPLPPDCIKLCTLPENDELAATCSFNGNEVGCENGVLPGGTAQLKCKPHYKPYWKTENTWVLTCGKDGNWSDSYPTCIPDCGHPNIINEAKPVITGGQTTKYGNYPWHIAIFKFFNHNDTFVNICGGTLISRRVVLTAAHCVVERQTLLTIEPKFLKVAAGKFTRPWDILDEFVQRNNVKRILYPTSYSANKNYYDHDIALIETEIDFQLNNFVLPACIELERHSVPANLYGLMLGWGMTDTDNFAEELREVELPHLDLLSCRSQFEYFTSFLTFDKFCVVYKKGSGVQEGDSGGGITFPRNNVYFVEGVVSLKPRGKNEFSAMTNISEHVTWLTNSLSTMGFIN